ncbi:MAG TPA: tetratricopeptide repeat protein [Kofleriaceae bacterium]|nr:tetratricopeptide repeat protein [Kofleriaceae bacterium]
MARAHSLIAFVAATILPIAAHAQSARYPPDAHDVDEEAEQRSALWESALDPERAPYEDLVRDGQRALQDQSERGARLAVDKLTDAIARIPSDPRAYGYRGEAYLELRDWTHCADDLAISQAHEAPATPPAAERDKREIELGICQARAGHLADAERTLVHAAEHGPRGEAWMRLGEVRIALGKLDEAIDALDSALDTIEGRSATTHWLLALAYDRAKRPTNAEQDGQIALAADAQLGMIVNPTYPWLGVGEGDYMLGLAHSFSPLSGPMTATPEYALIYFRHYLALAAESPWRRRAQEHVKALSALDWPQAIARNPGSSAILEIPVLRAAIAPSIGAMRSCVAQQPTAAYEISIIKVGPRSEPALDQVHYALKKPSVDVQLKLDIARDSKPVPAQAIETTRTCLQAIAARIAMPAAKEDTWYGVSFYVIAP